MKFQKIITHPLFRLVLAIIVAAIIVAMLQDGYNN